MRKTENKAATAPVEAGTDFFADLECTAPRMSDLKIEQKLTDAFAGISEQACRLLTSLFGIEVPQLRPAPLRAESAPADMADALRSLRWKSGSAGKPH